MENGILYIIIILNRANVKETVKCAKDCFGKKGYSILFGNCETFVTMCRYGDPISLQVSIHFTKYMFISELHVFANALKAYF